MIRRRAALVSPLAAEAVQAAERILDREESAAEPARA